MRPSMTLLCLAAILAGGCGRSGQQQQTEADARPWPDMPAQVQPAELAAFSAPEAQSISRDEFGVVTAKEREAIARLEESSWVELTPEEAESYLGKPLGGDGGRLVLLRGVAVNERLDDFAVRWREGAVLVSHVGPVGGKPKPPARRVLVARLPALPTSAYIHSATEN